jgi:hypothetical protein
MAESPKARLKGMPRGTARFRERELAKAVKAAARAGVDVERVELMPDGRINIILGKQAPAAEVLGAPQPGDALP